MDMTKLEFKGDNGRDEFQRELIADRVIQLLTSEIQISPMVIDGDWGTGKTEFCHKLMNKFRSTHDDYRLLYVDAFQADHADNPLMTILSYVMTLLEEGSTKTTLLEKALPVVRYGLATTAKAVVGHVLRQNADEVAEGLEEHLQDAANKAIDASVKALLKDHEEAQKNLQALQDTLAGVAQNSPIVIFIDELDRCRPDFAVQMLEVIKHTFNVEQVKFVLVTNTKQLKAAINHCYGSQVDAQRYLDKFLKFSFRLPDFVPGQSRRNGGIALASNIHFSNLVKQSAVLHRSGLSEQQNGLYGFAVSLIEKNDLSLREVETFIRHLEIYHSLSQALARDIIFGYQLLRLLGVFIFCHAPKVSELIQKDRPAIAEVTVLLGLVDLPDITMYSYDWSHSDVIAVLLAQESIVRDEQNKLSEENQERLKRVRSEYFRGYRGTGNLYDSIKEAIICLQLGSR